MCLKAPLIGELQHLVVYPCRIAYSQHVYASVDKLLAYPVYGHIALCAYQYLTLTGKSLIDSFNESCGLSCSGRPVHYGNILGSQHFVDGMLLCGIQPWQCYIGEPELLCFHLSRCKQVAQVGQPSATGSCHSV